MAIQVAGETYFDIDGQLHEIKRQLRQSSGYPFDPADLQKALQRAIEGKFGNVSAKTNEPKQKVEKPRLLKALDNITVGPLIQAFDLNQFFQTRKDLWVSDEMKKLVKKAAVAEPTDAVLLKRFDLTKYAYDRDIKAELPQNYEVQLWQIAKLIEVQEGGKDGPLLNSGYWNIFYVGGLVVSVHWRGEHRKWYVHARRLDFNRYWLDDYRVFSSN